MGPSSSELPLHCSAASSIAAYTYSSHRYVMSPQHTVVQVMSTQEFRYECYKKTLWYIRMWKNCGTIQLYTYRYGEGMMVGV